MVGRVRFFLLNRIEYVSLNSNPWDGSAPSLGNSWESGKSMMAAVILVNYKIFTLHLARNIICLCTFVLWHMRNSMELIIIVFDCVHVTKINMAAIFTNNSQNGA